jgi:hypothetical protein
MVRSSTLGSVGITASRPSEMSLRKRSPRSGMSPSSSRRRDRATSLASGVNSCSGRRVCSSRFQSSAYRSKLSRIISAVRPPSATMKTRW